MNEDQRPPEPGKARRTAGTAGGILAGLGLLAMKFKSVLLALPFVAKWLLIGPKLLLSFGSIFLSIWLYAQWFGGWKIAVVFVLMILVHELGHFFTWRNFGVQASLPLFIPGFGAFVSAPATGTAAQNAAAAIAGPAFGMAAAVVCWAYAVAHGEASLAPQARFWTACAYIGFFLNLFNLIPIPPFDGGSIAGAIDARLWFVGLVLLAVFVLFFGHSPFALIILVLVAITAIPRIVALWRGQLDPRGSGLSTEQRLFAFIAYMALLAIGIAGAAATYVQRTA